MGNSVTLIAAFGGGLLAFLSPCLLPLAPAYFASLAGPEVLEPNSKKIRLPLFIHSLAFVIGLSAVFIALGAIAGWAGFGFSSQILSRKIAGGLLIAFGVFMLLAIKIPWLNYEKRLNPSRSIASGYIRSGLTGAIFAVAWTPCASPILGGILALAFDSSTAWHGAYLLTFFSMGLGLPFLVLGIAFDFVSPLLKRVRRYSTVIYVASGLLLITAGLLTLNPPVTANLTGWWRL